MSSSTTKTVTTTCSPPPINNNTRTLPALVQNATLTNSELLGAILSAIKSSKSLGADGKKWIHVAARGHDAVASIVRGAAVGTVGYRTTDDWIRHFGDAYDRYQSAAADEGGTYTTSSCGDGVECRSLGDIVMEMPSDGQATRLRVALDAIDVATSTSTYETAQPHASANLLSVRQAVGLLRGAALVGDDDRRLQSRALACLVRVVPRLASHPLEILAVVQTPTLRLLDWNGLGGEMGPLSFIKSESQRQVFQSMVCFGKEEEDEGDAKEDTCSSSSGNGNQKKRKRPWEGTTSSTYGSDQLMRLVEAAPFGSSGRSARRQAWCRPLRSGR